ncbi:thiocillin family RiPP [Streptacidiphilus jiangxiensis]|uniref:Uncharacterized protein n=1 Tax=Streptacidiphilus jiangxiensis TaxID=235985 RepID=A0A1H7KQJ6_STRJI|nr:thiocillin family RiPP [Streptacidiphilus jiangxiensis]SEK89133.1 hypothetical protein SAMN05414137_104162 [Streptacidiphilus jiangxiensis]
MEMSDLMAEGLTVDDLTIEELNDVAAGGCVSSASSVSTPVSSVGSLASACL